MRLTNQNYSIPTSVKTNIDSAFRLLRPDIITNGNTLVIKHKNKNYSLPLSIYKSPENGYTK